MLIDNHNRIIDYLRLAVTDKCNLRCQYCMPEYGIAFKPKKELLSYEEMLRLVKLLVPMGISKIRITGGEPFLRKDLMQLLRKMSCFKGLDNIALTTNGVLTGQYLDELIDLNITSINLSLDSLNKERFLTITRRDDFDKVMTFYRQVLDKIGTLKINCVVMNGQNIEDLIPMVELAEKDNVSIRFIEEMPFNGIGKNKETPWTHLDIKRHIESKYRLIKQAMPFGATAQGYSIEGFIGSIGIIAAYSRSFCGSCNRIRLTPDGQLKTCLYDHGVFSVRDLMRNGASDAQLSTAIIEAVGNRAKDGFEAEQNRFQFPISESMATIGG